MQTIQIIKTNVEVTEPTKEEKLYSEFIKAMSAFRVAKEKMKNIAVSGIINFLNGMPNYEYDLRKNGIRVVYYHDEFDTNYITSIHISRERKINGEPTLMLKLSDGSVSSALFIDYETINSLYEEMHRKYIFSKI